MKVAHRLLHATKGEPESQLHDLARLGRSAPHQAEGPQRGGSDAIKVESRATWHQAPVVPQQLPQVAGVAFQVHCQRGALHNDLGLGHARCDGFDVRPKRDCCAVRNGQPAHREVDHQSRVVVRREGVAVYRALGADGEFTTDARAERRGVIARLRSLVVQLPSPAEAVEWLQHGVTRK